MGELLLEGVLWGLFYAVGKVVAQVFLPHLAIEPFTKQRSAPQSAIGYRWQGLTYTKGKQRFLYTESIAGIGAVFILLVGLALWAMVRFGV